MKILRGEDLGPVVLGVLSPHLWTWAKGVSAQVFSHGIIEWLWLACGIRGNFGFLVLSGLESLVFGALAALGLLAVMKGVRRRCAAVFCVAFVLSFYVPSLLASSDLGGDQAILLLSLPAVVGLLFCTVVVFGVLSKAGRRNAA